MGEDFVHPGHFYDFPGNGDLIVSLIVSEPLFANGVKTPIVSILARNQY